ncbi:hypothetical protein LC724_38045 [Blautia sp. RD014234]|nr:hypothetical protein [Blautia parvula]
MKIVCIGDLLLPPEMMEKGIEGFVRYDEKNSFISGQSLMKRCGSISRTWRRQGPAACLYRIRS